MTSSPLRSLHSAALAVVVTGTLSISIPLVLLAGFVGRASAGTSEQLAAPPSVQVVDCDGHSRAAQAVLHPGECVLMRANGFTSAQLVRVRLQSRPGWADVVPAQSAGELDYRMVVSRHAHPGRDRVSFVSLGKSVPTAAQFAFTIAAS